MKKNSPRKEMLYVLNRLPHFEAAGENRKYELLRLCFGNNDKERGIFEEEIYRLNSLLRLPLTIYKGERSDIGSTKEAVHSDSHTIGAALKKDAIRIFEELREDKAIGRKLTSEQAAWVTYFLLIRKLYPGIYQKFAASMGLDNIKTHIQEVMSLPN
jgi:hypothetical protein